MLQIKLGLSATVAAISAHTFYVYQERKNLPTGRLLQFSPGSQGTSGFDGTNFWLNFLDWIRLYMTKVYDIIYASSLQILSSIDDIIADTLKTGDIVLFHRDPLLYYLPAAVTIALRQYGQSFSSSSSVSSSSSLLRNNPKTSVPDHIGIIVLHQGIPYVMEQTFSGIIKVRRYDARIRCSRSKEIMIRPLSTNLTKEQKLLSNTFIQPYLPKYHDSSTENTKDTNLLVTVLYPWQELVRTLVGIVRATRNETSTTVSNVSSLTLLQQYYRTIGLYTPSDNGLSNIALLDYIPNNQPIKGTKEPLYLNKLIWVRDLA